MLTESWTSLWLMQLDVEGRGLFNEEIVPGYCRVSRDKFFGLFSVPRYGCWWAKTMSKWKNGETWRFLACGDGG
jgi:hypothetical protein